MDSKTELPRCNKCGYCIPEHTEYIVYICEIYGMNVNQSYFGGNSPRCCPIRNNIKISKE